MTVFLDLICRLSSGNHLLVCSYRADEVTSFLDLKFGI